MFSSPCLFMLTYFSQSLDYNYFVSRLVVMVDWFIAILRREIMLSSAVFHHLNSKSYIYM